ncbi:MAG: 3-oxoacyl-ACP reductase FabG [Oscillospiraceae bacterium]
MPKVALITGASRGIGAAIAIALAKSGYSVAICYNSNEQKANDIVNALNSEGLTSAAFKADITIQNDITNLCANVKNVLGNIELLVNNAGISQQKLFCELSENDIDKMLDTNIKGAMLCSKAVLPDMISRHKGCIINIASMWGETGASCEVHYSAAKAAIIGFTKALAKELAPSGIRVNCVSPGAVDTDMLAFFTQDDKQAIINDTPLGRLGTAEDIANAVEFLSSDKASFITGQILSVNGGILI